MVPLLSAATKDLKLLRILTFRNENLTDLLSQDLLKNLLQIKPTSKQDITDVIQICFSISRVSHQLTEEQFKQLYFCLLPYLCIKDWQLLEDVLRSFNLLAKNASETQLCMLTSNSDALKLLLKLLKSDDDIKTLTIQLISHYIYN